MEPTSPPTSLQGTADDATQRKRRLAAKQLVRQAAERLLEALYERYPDQTHIAFEVLGQNGKLHLMRTTFTDKVAAA